MFVEIVESKEKDRIDSWKYLMLLKVEGKIFLNTFKNGRYFWNNMKSSKLQEYSEIHQYPNFQASS